MAIETPRGVRVELPGHHRCVIYTDTPDDSQTMADLVRRNGCQATLFDLEPTNNAPITGNGAFSR